MGNGHGGRRPGAGRKPGSPTKRRREIIDKAAAEGITPLELQLSAMRTLWARAHRGPEVDLVLLKEASSIAAARSAYVHPRLSAVQAQIQTVSSLSDAALDLQVIDVFEDLIMLPEHDNGADDAVIDGEVIDDASTTDAEIVDFVHR